MNYIIFGGTGFIGTHLIHMLQAHYAKPNDQILVLDIVMPGEEGVVPGVVEQIEGVEYIRCDVRNPIEISFTPTSEDWIFNLAAVHRTPGHKDYEYFETNIKGAENVINWAERYGITKILFTSSIAPYGAGETLKTEETLPTPNTPYGISKLVAEKIHQVWQARGKGRQLLIVRPGVVFGRGEHGNFTRLYWGIRKRYFMYTGRKDTIKACIYVKELVNFIMWKLSRQETGVEVFNCTFNPAFTIEEICNTMMQSTNLKRHIPKIPSPVLLIAAGIFGLLGGRLLGIHPDRVKKLMISTNISGQKMSESNYLFLYSLEGAIRDWYKDCNCKGLY